MPQNILLLMLLLPLGLMTSCHGGRVRADRTEVATIVVKKLPNYDYDSIQLALDAQDGGGGSLKKSRFPASNEPLKVTMRPGSYRVTLELLKASQVILSSEACPSDVAKSQLTLVPGPNVIEVPVCPPNPEGGSGDQSQKTFYLAGGKLMDPSGRPFVMRGVNTPNAYYKKQSLESLSRIKTMGFNTVRIVWCADTYQNRGRCDPKDIHPVDDLRAVFAALKDQKLVGMLNLQNVTGLDTAEALEKMADYLLKEPVKTLLLEYQKEILINIANEWYGSWDRSRNYVDAYAKVVRRLRDGGLPHVLVVDLRGYGQDISSLSDSGDQLVALDPNLMLSGHFYDQFATDGAVASAFRLVRSKALPFLVGEFGCSHGSKGKVACESILKEASRKGEEYGYIGWSWTGNSGDLDDLDIVDASDWSTLTPWGKTLVHGTGGIRETSREACFFGSASSCQN